MTQEVGQIHSRHLEEAAGRTAAAADAIVAAQGPLVDTLACLDQLREAAAEQQEADTAAAVELQQLLDDGCR